MTENNRSPISEAMFAVFKRLMQGFIPEDTKISDLKINQPAILNNVSSGCYYLCKKVNDEWVLGFHGVSKFTNYRYYEVNLRGELLYEWYCHETYIVGDAESERRANENNEQGFARMEAFGIKNDIDIDTDFESREFSGRPEQ
jgi:hypothetical protein